MPLVSQQYPDGYAYARRVVNVGQFVPFVVVKAVRVMPGDLDYLPI